MRLGLIGMLLGWACLVQADESCMTPQDVLQQLLAGNQRYKEEKLLHPNHSKEARVSLAAGQAPCAIILGCSDSRVSPEIIFDQGIGDLFIVRVAGNVADRVELDSIKYAALYLKSPLILVVGHENCGAVQAVINGQTKDIQSVASMIRPSLKLARTQTGSLLENTIKDNVLYVVEKLKKNSELADLIQKGMLNIVGGYYHFASGDVEILKKN
jgi:carbonic anhydrase